MHPERNVQQMDTKEMDARETHTARERETLSDAFWTACNPTEWLSFGEAALTFSVFITRLHLQPLTNQHCGISRSV